MKHGTTRLGVKLEYIYIHIYIYIYTFIKSLAINEIINRYIWIRKEFYEYFYDYGGEDTTWIDFER